MSTIVRISPEQVYRKLSEKGKQFFHDSLFNYYIKNSSCKDCTKKFIIASFLDFIESSESSETRIISNYENNKIISNYINDQYYNDYPILREKFPEAFI